MEIILLYLPVKSVMVLLLKKELLELELIMENVPVMTDILMILVNQTVDNVKINVLNVKLLLPIVQVKLTTPLINVFIIYMFN